MTNIQFLKNSEGSDLQVRGCGEHIQLLLLNNLVDEIWLKIHSLTLGNGKILFANGVIPMAFTKVESTMTPGGVIIAYYKRSGEVRSGTVGA